MALGRKRLAGSSKTRQLRCIQISTMPIDRTEWISLTVALAGLLTALILVYLSLTTTAKPSAYSGCLDTRTLPQQRAASVRTSNFNSLEAMAR
jgi:hypothetical protein